MSDQSEEITPQISSILITIDRQTKRQIEDLIVEHYEYTFPMYCDRVGIKPPNFYASLNGSRKCTVEFLNKLLSGINYQVSVDLKLILHPLEIGGAAPYVDYVEQEIELHSNDEVGPDEYDSF